MVQALAWRSLQRLMFFRSVGGDSSDTEVAAVASALRALQAHDTSGDQCLVLTEVLDFLRVAIQLTTSAQRREAYLKQTLASGLLEGGLLARFLSSGERGLQRGAIRLLRVLFATDVPTVKSQLLQSRLWPRVVSVEGHRCDVERHGGAAVFDAVALMGDVAGVVAAAATDDPQVFLWILSSTELLACWEHSLQNFVIVAELSLPVTRTDRWADVMLVHLQAVGCCAAAVRTHLVSDLARPVTGILETWTPFCKFLKSAPLGSLVLDSFHERLSVEIRSAAASVLATISGLQVLGLDVAQGEREEELGRRCCALFQRLIGDADHAWLSPRGTEQPLSESGSNASSLAVTAHSCLVNFFHVSPAAGAAACRLGFLQTLTEHIVELAQVTEQPLLRGASQPVRLVWALRVLTELVVSSGSVLEDALGDGSSSAKGTPVLQKLLQCLRSTAEKDDAVCLEVLELLTRCAHAEQVEDESQGERTASFLLRVEFVQWMMRLSQRRQLPCTVYSKLLGVLALCAPVLSGRPLVVRYVAHIVDVVRKSCLAPGQQQTDEWRTRRLVASLHFVACLRLCSRCSSLLVSSMPSAHTAGVGSSRIEGPGMDLWLDLIEVEGRAHSTVRAAALRVLLSVISGTCPHAKSYFLGTPRPATVLLKLIRNGHPTLATISLNIVWVLAHNNQRAVALLKRLNAVEVVEAVHTAEWVQKGPKDVGHVLLMATGIGQMMQ